MADAPSYPFSSFNFSVEIHKGGEPGVVCSGEFSECDGLEMTMEVKTIREGGNNGRQIRLTGPFAYGQLTLKRGMTRNTDLWTWFSQVLEDPGLRGEAEIVVLAPDHRTECARFVASRCVPVKLKAPPLNAREGGVAIEELQVAYESIRLQPPRILKI